MNNDNVKIEFSKFIKENEKTLKRDFEKKFETLTTTLHVIYSGFNTCKERKYIHNIQFWNIAGYINICYYDLAVVIYHIFFEEYEWHRNFYARQGILIVYEALNDIPEFMKDYRASLSLLSNGKEFNEELNIIMKDFNSFKKSNIDKLREIRNTVGGHKDKSLSVQMEHIFAVNWVDILEKYFKPFDELLLKLGQFTQKVMMESSNEKEMDRLVKFK